MAGKEDFVLVQGLDTHSSPAFGCIERGEVKEIHKRDFDSDVHRIFVPPTLENKVDGITKKILAVVRKEMKTMREELYAELSKDKKEEPIVKEAISFVKEVKSIEKCKDKTEALIASQVSNSDDNLPQV